MSLRGVPFRRLIFGQQLVALPVVEVLPIRNVYGNYLRNSNFIINTLIFADHLNLYYMDHYSLPIKSPSHDMQVGSGNTTASHKQNVI